MNVNIGKRVSAPIRFLIGLSAGFIAACLPKLSGFLSTAQDTVVFNMFTTQFITATVVFSLIIGIAMVWLYMDSIESTKNLFMSALALPAVLSGSISMSDVSKDAEQQIKLLNQQNTALETQLQDAFGIDIDSENNGADFGDNVLNSIVPTLFGINNAYAEKPLLKKDSKWQANTHFKTKNLDKSYYLLFGKSKNTGKLKIKKNKLKQKTGLKQLAVIPKGDKSYLIQNIPRTRSDALLNAIKLKKQKIEVKIISIK